MAPFMSFFTITISLCFVTMDTQITPSFDNSTALTTMGFDGGGLFLNEFECPSTYVCPNPLESKSKVLPKWDDLNCQCDDACAVYGDCCINAKFYNANATVAARNLWKCKNLVEYRGLYMRTTCPESWPADFMREKCEGGGVLEAGHRAAPDPLSMTPVTSLITRYTYQNVYCAYCSGDVERAIYWIPRIECDDILYYNSTGNISEQFVWSNLQFNNETLHWGIFLNSSHSNLKLNLGMEPPRPTSRTGAQNSNFITCRVMVQMPATVDDLVRHCKPWTNDCPSDWKDDKVRQLCYSYTAAVYGSPNSDDSYRNVHCAMCHDVKIPELICNGGLLYRTGNPASFAPSFAFLFDINENSGEVVGTVKRCKSEGEIYDPFFKMCRQMVCANSNFQLRNGRCVKNEETKTTTTFSPTTTTTAKTLSSSSIPEVTSKIKDNHNENDVTSMDPTVKNVSEITETNELATEDGSDCLRFNISRLHYHFFANGSIYIEEYDRYYIPSEYTSAPDGSILICIPLAADDLEHFYKRKFSVVLAYLTLTCLGISLVCLVAHLFAFTQVPALRNLQGKDLASLCVALVVAYVTFIISQFQESVSNEMCTSVGVVLYYSFLASFFWMNSISFDVWRTLRLATSELRVSSGQQWQKFIIYSTYSWFGSALVVIAAIIVENSSYVPRIYKPSFGLVTCWFGSRRALQIFFVTPITIIILINMLMFILSARIIVSTTRNSAILHPSSKARRNFQLYLRLALIMGLTWVFGIVAGQVDKEPIWYVFVILNALQGLFIFVSFTCTQKVRVHLTSQLLCKGENSEYYSSTKKGKHPRKFELEGRDSGSGESQSSQTSHLSLSKTGSHISKASTDTLY
ncbi:hypothetical protein CHUAL_011720 [Chamberlinius hualienensis]